MHSSKFLGSKILGLGLIAGFVSVSAFAEPPIQPGETLESLSQVKVSTTVNGHPGSLEELAASGKIKILGEATSNAAPATEAPAAVEATNPESENQAPAQAAEELENVTPNQAEASEAPLPEELAN